MMDEVVGFMLAMLLGTGVAFELPVVLAVMGWLGLVDAQGLWRFNKYALVLSTVVGGVLTPGPDVLSQVLMAGPLFGLYNVSILHRLDDRAGRAARGWRSWQGDRRRSGPQLRRRSSSARHVLDGARRKKFDGCRCPTKMGQVIQ